MTTPLLLHVQHSQSNATQQLHAVTHISTSQQLWLQPDDPELVMTQKRLKSCSRASVIVIKRRAPPLNGDLGLCCPLLLCMQESKTMQSLISCGTQVYYCCLGQSTAS